MKRRSLPVQSQGWQSPGKNRREFFGRLNVKHAGLLSRDRQPLKRMKIADRVYLITDQLQTGAGIPGVIRAMEDDSMVEVDVEFAHGTKILKVRSCDILPSNLYTYSILNVVYQTYQEIERDCGSILNLKADIVVQKLIDHSLALQTARQCVDFLDEVDWYRAQLPLRQWLKRIQRFYHDKP